MRKKILCFRETFCLRKINDQWLITHLHQSVPFYMDGSFKAAIDLKPQEEENSRRRARANR